MYGVIIPGNKRLWSVVKGDVSRDADINAAH
jgi:hypothetical protein